jgi:hypothetical protein
LIYQHAIFIPKSPLIGMPEQISAKRREDDADQNGAAKKRAGLTAL